MLIGAGHGSALKGKGMGLDGIRTRVSEVLASLGQDVVLVGAAKTRTAEEMRAAIDAGLTIVGHNYVQEAGPMVEAIGPRVEWHLIGHLQRNKAALAVTLFDMIETLDSLRLANAIGRHAAAADKVMPVLVEINSGAESSKTGVLPSEVDELVRRVGELPHVHVQGLMTMGPAFGDPEDARPYFRLAKQTFDRLAAADIPNVEMRYLSMGMSNSYRVAIEEGANMVRVGSGLFGRRE